MARLEIPEIGGGTLESHHNNETSRPRVGAGGEEALAVAVTRCVDCALWR